MKILLVDDEPTVLTIVSKLLLHAGHTVDTAPDGEHALDSLQGEDFQVVITDLRMPGMDGLTLARAIRARKPAQRIVLLTGGGHDGVLPPNVDFVLEKPLKWGALAQVLEPLAA